MRNRTGSGKARHLFLIRIFVHLGLIWWRQMFGWPSSEPPSIVAVIRGFEGQITYKTRPGSYNYQLDQGDEQRA